MPFTDPDAYIASLNIAGFPPDVDQTKLTTRFNAFYESGTQEATTYVDNASLISFAAEVNGQYRQDVLNSTLLAQLAADHKHPNYTDPIGWYNTYVNVLKNIGWVVQSSDFLTYQSGEQDFVMDKAVINILTSLAASSTAPLLVLQSTLKALESMADADGKIKLFESKSHDLQNGNFQLGLATETNGAVALNVSTFVLETTEQIKRILFFKTSKDRAQLRFRNSTCTLNSDLYADFRVAIRQKLGQKPLAFIDKLEIGPLS